VARLHYLDDPAELERERATFVDAALELLRSSDTVDLQVSQVVRAAGRHNAAFYRVFGSKEGLALAVAEEAARRTAAVLARRTARRRSPADGVRTWARTLLALAATPRTADGTQALALDRFRLMQRHPTADRSTSALLTAPLEELLDEAGVDDVGVRMSAAFELVMSRQASWIATGHRPGPAELDAYAGLVVELCGLRPGT
jgi:AcrR family transcriptional regulator